MTNAAPPGWYSDPANPTTEHLWDGTAYVQSRPMAPASPMVLSSSQVMPYAPGVGVVARYAGQVSPKSRTVASILGFFFGGFGVDRFYLGNVGLGVAKLLLGWLTGGLWPLIDWIIILAGAAHDGDGLPVTNWN